jgi:hypothetical protein
MGIRIDMLDPLTDVRYETFVQRHPEAAIFHHPAWLRALKVTYQYLPYCVAAFRGTEPVGMLTLMDIRSMITGKRGVCLPFTDRCGPLVLEQSVANLLLQKTLGLADKLGWRYVEIREEVREDSYVAASHFLGHQLRLGPDAQMVFRGFKRAHVQHIRKAMVENIRVERRTDRAALNEFIRMNAVTRRKHGVPPQPASFFLNLFESLLSSGRGFISLAFLGSKPIAASVFLYCNRTITYKYSASDPESLSYCPNHLIVWDAVQWGCQNGYMLLDFGRTDPLDAGLLQYKRGWSPKESELNYFRSPGNRGLPPKEPGRASEVLKPAIRLTPLPILKVVGKLIYRHVG